MTNDFRQSPTRRAFLGLLAQRASRSPISNHGATARSLEGGGATVRMVADLQRALQRPPADRRWTMLIDTRRCIGCSACTIACIAENNLPPGVTYRKVPELEAGSYPDVIRAFMPTNCMQCQDAPCVEAANQVLPGAMRKRPDGIVEIDYRVMKGRAVFEAAKKACPYEGALYFDDGGNHTDATPELQGYERRKVREYGREWTREDTKGTTRKCHFCSQRLDRGMLPACVSTCTGLAMRFGDAADPRSLVAEQIAAGTTRCLIIDRDTRPNVRYIDDWRDADGQAPPLVNRRRVDCALCHQMGR
jgi:molybdopterin-containing oxidoreductase family iron-sulfur binding subunit